MLAAGDLTPVGLKKLVSKMDVLTNIISDIENKRDCKVAIIR